MPNYKIRLFINISGYSDVLINAESEDQAIDLAEDMVDFEEVCVEDMEVVDAEIIASISDDGEVFI